MFLSLETLMSIIKTSLLILVELIDLMNSVITSNDLTQMINFPMVFWISFFLLTLVFVLQ